MNFIKPVGILVLFVLLAVVAACGAPPTPETVTVVETVVVEKESEPVTVVETVEVVKEVEKIVEVEAEAAAKPFEGVEVNILTFVGPQVAEPLQRRGPDFTELTGATVNVVTVPNAELYQKALADLATGTNSFDGFLFAPQWIVDFAPAGFLEDLTDRVHNDEALEWDDIAPFFQDFNSYDGKVYSIPLDGDFHMVYYRTDLLEEAGLEPPRTWDDYLNIAKTLNGQDFDGDGEGDYGSCIAKARAQQSYWWIYSIAAPFIQSQGTSQGAFFNTETMEPLVNNDAFKRALEVYKETTDYGPPDELNLGVGDTRGLFTSGRCALSLDWGDIGTLAIDPENSNVQDKVGAVITPGSTQVLDWETGELVDCDETTCPYAVDGVNYAPYASFGGWAGAVNAAADDTVKDATYAFFSYMSQPAQANEDVTIGRTGYNPYRFSQFLNRQLWVKNGMSPEAAANYLGAIEASLNSPNMVLDLRIPQNQSYQQVELDRILAQYLAGELDTDQAAQEINDAWDEITDEAGREQQLEAYRATIGAN
ncbi:MAG: extracellular solute-binding protein [Anaerolineae bacterium]|nr:extracellular solute-binding protein [Anaerolineae bacterium]MCB0222586.1 extracellular solute-binding protein [Anaerolineae bacterium]MCB9106510.1 extracellular solute-binding protein [Anaerolineales bacterium]